MKLHCRKAAVSAMICSRRARTLVLFASMIGAALATSSCDAKSGPAGTGTLIGTPVQASDAPVSLQIAPSSPAMTVGEALQLTATATRADASSVDFSQRVTWTSSNAQCALVDARGLVTSVAEGTSTISASLAGKIVSVLLTVRGRMQVETDPTAGSRSLPGPAPAPAPSAVVEPVKGSEPAGALVSIALDPESVTVAAGASQRFVAIGTFGDGSKADISAKATWSTSSEGIAKLDGSPGTAVAISAGASAISATVDGISSSAALTVTEPGFAPSPAPPPDETPAPSLVALAVTPDAASTSLGTSKQFMATGTYSDGSTQDLTGSATWTSSVEAKATIDGTGVASTVATGSTMITASSRGVSGTSTLTVTPPDLVSIAIMPAPTSIALGTTRQFAAIGTYTDGSTQTITTAVTWSSSAIAKATVNASSGLAATVATGLATITATSGDVSGSATLTVTAPALVSIAVTPASPSAPLGTTQQFTATGTYTNGSTQDLTGSATWTSSVEAKGTIDGSGLATSVAVGSTTISATSGGISGTAILTVAPPALVSIAVAPDPASIALGTTRQFAATGTYTDGSTQTITTAVTWTSSATAKATIDSTSGLATSVATGPTTITATSSGIAGTAALTVTPATLVSIAVTPTPSSIALGTTRQFVAVGTYSDGSSLALASGVTWGSLTTATATVDADGLATAVAPGTTTITAAVGELAANASLTVTSATLVSIAVTPDPASTPKGSPKQFVATGTFSDASTQDITTEVAWTSSTAATATINGSTGLAASVATGTTTITATSGGISGAATLTVTAPALVSIAVTPANPSAALGTTKQFAATGTYTDGTTQVLTGSSTWTSATTAKATINSTSGLATTVAQGTSTITATHSGIAGNTTLTIAAPALTSISVSPTSWSAPVGTTRQYTATGFYSNGSTQNLTNTATWTSSATSKATVNSATGLATAVAVGTSSIQATSGGISGSRTLTVVAVALSSITVTPANSTALPGATKQFTATGNYNDGSTQNLTNSATWSSSVTAKATINSTSGLATAVAAGSTTVTATSGAISGNTTFTVITLSSITVTPDTPSIGLTGTQQMQATGVYSDASTADLTGSVTWASSVTAKATISGTGLATPVATGTTTISATSGAISGNTVLKVVQATMIAAGQDYTCAVVNGAARCWGRNVEGQLGNNSTQTSSTPVQVQGLTSGVTAIAVSNYPFGLASSCAVVNGGVQCWGDNQCGQLGDNSTTDSLVPVQVSGIPAGSGATAVAVGAPCHACAVVNGGVKCWGGNGSGQLGNGTNTSSLVPVAVSGLTSGATALALPSDSSCAVVSGGVQCWGYMAGWSTVPVSVSGLGSGSGVTGLSGAYLHVCAVVNGGAKCWGENYTGTLGNNSTTDSTTPVQVSGLAAGSGVTNVSAGNTHSCAIVSGGAKCWGDNVSAQLGDNSGNDSLVPVQVSGLTASSGATAIAAGFFFSCGIVNGVVSCWGADSDGAVGQNPIGGILDLPAVVEHQ